MKALKILSVVSILMVIVAGVISAAIQDQDNRPEYVGGRAACISVDTMLVQWTAVDLETSLREASRIAERMRDAEPVLSGNANRAVQLGRDARSQPSADTRAAFVDAALTLRAACRAAGY